MNVWNFIKNFCRQVFPDNLEKDTNCIACKSKKKTKLCEKDDSIYLYYSVKYFKGILDWSIAEDDHEWNKSWITRDTHS